MLCNPALSVSEQVVSQRYYTPSPDKENLPTLFPLRLPNNLKIREHTKIQFCNHGKFFLDYQYPTVNPIESNPIHDHKRQNCHLTDWYLVN